MAIERINPELCNGCGICVTTCPVDVIRLDTAAKEKGEQPGCQMACPAGVDMRRYLYLLREGLIMEAMTVLRDSLPIPAVTGRVCSHPCETQCFRSEVDEPVNINGLERFVAAYCLNQKAQPIRKIYAAKVAVIGSGPAGLSCAYFLARMGYPVTIFEAMPVCGGMLMLGIPEHRLPKEVLEAQIDYIQDLGVEFRTGVTIGRDIALEALQKDYQAIFYGIGNQLSKRLSIPGSGLDGVIYGLDFLRDIKLTRGIKVKDKVVVIGGGNVAVDVALTALRSGAKEVYLACVEPKAQMPGQAEEINQAVEEGVILFDCCGPKTILGDEGKATGVELVRCVSIVDKHGEFNPCYDEQETKTVATDMIILAVGQEANLSILPQGMMLSPNSRVQTDPITLETSLAGVFAGGDIVSGQAWVVEAIAAGKRASISIDRYLKGEDLKKGRYLRRAARVKNPPKEGVDKIARKTTPSLPVLERAKNFREVRGGFNEDNANLEAQRCMTCGSLANIAYAEDCMLCLYCERDCPQKAIYVSPEKKITPLIAWG
jgi:NADPH-dependent glutamate synthase beta subunit-like oxidoreductase